MDRHLRLLILRLAEIVNVHVHFYTCVSLLLYLERLKKAYKNPPPPKPRYALHHIITCMPVYSSVSSHLTSCPRLIHTHTHTSLLPPSILLLRVELRNQPSCLSFFFTSLLLFSVPWYPRPLIKLSVQQLFVAVVG